MRLDFRHERVLAVVAHPDDAELLCAGTLGRAQADGAEIGICVLCKGDKGQPATGTANLAATRRHEMTAAAKVLGAALSCGGFGDGELVDTPASRRKLVQLYRRFRPTLVLAHAAVDYHPDHRAAAGLAEAASWFAASRGHKTRSAPLPSPPALWWMDTVNMLGFEPGFYIDVSEYMGIKERMLECHRSQQARADDSDFDSLQDLMLRQCTTRGAQAGVAAAEAFRIHRAWQRTRAW